MVRLWKVKLNMGTKGRAKTRGALLTCRARIVFWFWWRTHLNVYIMCSCCFAGESKHKWKVPESKKYQASKFALPAACFPLWKSESRQSTQESFGPVEIYWGELRRAALAWHARTTQSPQIIFRLIGSFLWQQKVAQKPSSAHNQLELFWWWRVSGYEKRKIVISFMTYLGEAYNWKSGAWAIVYEFAVNKNNCLSLLGRK